jgi:hypothetical protein
MPGMAGKPSQRLAGFTPTRGKTIVEKTGSPKKDMGQVLNYNILL